jgi:large subunit ribosomal protein L21
MYAIIETGGKQFKVANGDVIYVEKLDAQIDAQVEFTPMVLADGESIQVGAPLVEGVKVTAKVLQQGKSRKVIAFKHKSKKDFKKKQGHRQPFTKLEIISIG